MQPSENNGRRLFSIGISPPPPSLACVPLLLQHVCAATGSVLRCHWHRCSLLLQPTLQIQPDCIRLVAKDKAMFRPGGKSTAMASDGKVKVHTIWPDGCEQLEEYDQKTEQLLTRKLRKKTPVGGEGTWEFEIGEPPPRPSDAGIVENPDNPVCVRRDTRRQFQCRVRNISFPVEVYQISISPEEHTVTIRTSNKKWFKKLVVPDTQRLGCLVKPDSYLQLFFGLLITRSSIRQLCKLRMPIAPWLCLLTSRTP